MSDLPADPGPRPQRVRGEELRRRIELVKSNLLSGKSRWWVAQLIASEWGLKPSQKFKYIRQAEAEIREVVDRNAKDWLAEHISIRRDIRRRANDQNDLRTELAASDSEAKLLGLMDGKNDPAPNRGDADGPVTVREVVIGLHPDSMPEQPASAEPAGDRPAYGGAGPADGPPDGPLP
jgi:hypothetical protein